MIPLIQNRAALPAAILAAAILVSCHRTPASSNNTAVAQSNSAQPAPSGTEAAPSAGPDVLSTVTANGPPLTRVAARQGTFAIEKVNGIDTLTLDHRPTSYKEDGGNAPVPVAANESIMLQGVFELPKESVAWVTIVGGTACAGTQVLVGARSGMALPGQSIPGCDDRGSMRRDGDTITFDAGGSEGSYKDGLVTVTSKPAGYEQPVGAAAPADMVPAR